jgi:5-(carboxyamino)imidazole ribonucleotide synthase
MKRVGVIGGGQLAWMMAGAAEKLGIELVIQTPQTTDPAVAIASHTVLAPVADAQATAELANHCDVITFENEFVDLDGLSQLAQQGVRFYPQLNTLAPLLDKYHQRCYLQELGIPVPAFKELTEQADPATLSELGFPVVLKARRHGYDGQGTYIIHTLEELQTLLPKLERSALMLEAFVPFEQELAIMVARSLDGKIITYPVVETQQEQQVCRRVLVTGEFDSQVIQQAEAIAHALMANLQVVGIFGIELFLTPEGNVLVNEIAPRTHNSGHFTLDACVTSQFEQQLRAVCGLPLSSSELTCAGAVMVNLLGYESSQNELYLAKRQQLAQIPYTHVYWYGKTTSRPGRKLGHVTTLLQGESVDERRSQALEAIRAIESVWYPSK